MRHDELNNEESESGVFSLIEVARTIGQLTPEQRRRGELAIVRSTNQAWTNRAPWQLRLQVLVVLVLAFIGAAIAVRNAIAPEALSYVVEIGSAHEAQLTQPSGTSGSALSHPSSPRSKSGAAPKSKNSK
jgi:hypothetical protein